VPRRKFLLYGQIKPENGDSFSFRKSSFDLVRGLRARQQRKSFSFFVFCEIARGELSSKWLVRTKKQQNTLIHGSSGGSTSSEFHESHHVYQ
jgi:hypothetical protein